jgi:hypothetical protein
MTMMNSHRKQTGCLIEQWKKSTEALHTAIESALPLRLGSLKASEKKQPHP